jgi:hypothetical protein
LGRNHAPLAIELRFGDMKVGLGLRYGELVWERVDLEQQIALGDASILHDGKLDYATPDCSCDVHDIRVERAIGRGRADTTLVQGIKSKRDGRGDNHKREQSTEMANAGPSGRPHVIAQS